MLTLSTLIVAAMLGAGTEPAQASLEALAARSAQGTAAMDGGRFDEAVAIYEELVARRPSDAGLHLNLGMAQYMAGRPELAVAPLQKATTLQPGLAPAQLFLGAALLDLGRAKEALPPLGRAVKAMPDNAQARELVARASLETERFDEAGTHYRALTALDSSSPRSWYGLARSYEGLAEQSLQALQAQAPNSPLLELVLADVLAAQQRHADALRLYREVAARGPTVGGLHESIAEIYEAAGRSDWAQREMDKVKPRTAKECAARPAECAFLAGRFTEALREARRATTPAGRYWSIRAANRLATEALARLESMPASVELHLIRAEVAQTRGRRTDAVQELKAALVLAPGDAVLELALAEALVRALDFDEALPLIERLEREQPDSPGLLNLHGEALLQAQRVEEAIPLLERAVKADPSLVSASASLGRAYVQAGRFPDAVPHLRAAAATDEDGSVHYQLARAYQATGMVEEARLAMEEYQKRQPASAPEAGERTGTTELTPPD